MLSTKTCYFSPQELSLLNKEKTPKHIAIIPDGNRRWAQQLRFNISSGHQEGGNTLIEVVKAAYELEIKTLTFYLFSTENWARPQEEIDALMWLLNDFLITQLETLLDYDVKLHTIGILERLPEYVQSTIAHTKQATSHCKTTDLVLAIDYGSRDEMKRVMQTIATKCCQGKLTLDEITEETIAKHLDTSPWGDPELLIRTSGEMRLSNYLLWQLSYSEIYVTEVLWPNFRPKHLLEALINYQSRHRRLGKQ